MITPTMLAWRLKRYGKLSIALQQMKVATPKPLANQVLIQCEAASLNPVDYKIAEGQLKLFYKQQMPAPLAFDVAGTIAEVGSNVKGFSVGDAVFACAPTSSPGSLAPYFCVNANVVAAKPTNISFTEAASIPLVGLTTLSCFDEVQLKKGQTVLVQAGSGGVGSFAIQYAKSLGATVICTTSTSNVNWVKALGADKVIDYKTENYWEVCPKVDVVFDTLGGDHTLKSFDLLNPGGHVVSIAGRRLTPKAADQYGLPKLLKVFMFFQTWSIRKLCKNHQAHYHFILNQPTQERLLRIKQLLETEKIKPIIDEVFAFDDGLKAIQKLHSGRAKGKIVISTKQ